MKLPSGAWVPGTFATEAEADVARRAGVKALRTQKHAIGAVTFYSYAAARLDKRERMGVANVRTDRQNLEHHYREAHFADWPLENIRRRDVRRFRDELLSKEAMRSRGKGKPPVATGKPLGRQTVENILNVGRATCREAVEDELIAENPFRGVTVPRETRTEEETDDGWTFLTLDEQKALAQIVPAHPEALLALVAAGTGLREGEMWTLHLADVHVDVPEPRIKVRHGGRRKIRGTKTLTPPKYGRTREVPLFGVGLAAMRAWLAYLPRFTSTNKFELVFPGKRGGFRAMQKYPKAFPKWLRAAGVKRRVRWHDLRHTMGSALVSGMWGRTWSLQEVRDILGHRSITTTERYAHLAPSALKMAAHGESHAPALAQAVTEAAKDTRRTHPAPLPGKSGGKAVSDASFVNRRSGVQIPRAAQYLAEDVSSECPPSEVLEDTARGFASLLVTEALLEEAFDVLAFTELEDDGEGLP